MAEWLSYKKRETFIFRHPETETKKNYNMMERNNELTNFPNIGSTTRRVYRSHSRLGGEDVGAFRWTGSSLASPLQARPCKLVLVAPTPEMCVIVQENDSWLPSYVAIKSERDRSTGWVTIRLTKIPNTLVECGVPRCIQYFTRTSGRCPT